MNREDVSDRALTPQKANGWTQVQPFALFGGWIQFTS